MQTARYHREHAELCLEMARSMSDREAAAVLCMAAARHFAHAIELEKQAWPVSEPTGDNNRQAPVSVSAATTWFQRHSPAAPQEAGSADAERRAIPTTPCPPKLKMK